LLIVAPTESGKIIGTLQITFIPGISFKGGTRALIEAIMVDAHFRSLGIGSHMV